MTTLLGHDAQIAAFLAELDGGRLHHAWLLTGAEGIGKASLAHQFARYALAKAAGPEWPRDTLSVPRDHPVGRLVDGYSHPDFVLVERLAKDPKATRDLGRADWPRDLERARSITVDQVRALGSVFALRPSFSSRRIVIVDAIDDMERSGANALLKSLEEPPAGTIFLLISHAPGRLLPTIRSRCRTLRFDPLGASDMARAVRAALPETPDAEIAALFRAGAGSPGRALGFAGLDIAGIDQALEQLAANGDASGALRVSLAQKLSAKAAHQRYEAFLSRAPSFIAGVAKTRGGAPLGQAIEAWSEATALADSAVRQSLDPQMTVFALAGLVAGLAQGAAIARS